MRIFVLGAGATGSLLAQLLVRQGHTVWCGDRDLQRAHHFLGKHASIAITDVNARNMRGIVRAARGYLETVVLPAVTRAERVTRATSPATRQSMAAIRKMP